MVRHFGKNTTWMKWFSGKFITRGMLWWVVPLLVTLSSITWLRWEHNSFRMTTLILLPTANLLSEAQHFFVGPPLGPHMWMQRAGCKWVEYLKFGMGACLGTNTLWIPKNNCSSFYPETASQVRIYSLGAVFRDYLNWFFSLWLCYQFEHKQKQMELCITFFIFFFFDLLFCFLNKQHGS